jgi:hypothetical protein
MGEMPEKFEVTQTVEAQPVKELLERWRDLAAPQPAFPADTESARQRLRDETQALLAALQEEKS